MPAILALLTAIAGLIRAIPWGRVISLLLTIVSLVEAFGPTVQGWLNALTGHVDERFDDVGTALTKVEDGIRGLPGPERTDLPSVYSVAWTILQAIEPEGSLYQEVVDSLNLIIQQGQILRASVPVANTGGAWLVWGTPVQVSASGFVMLGESNGVQIIVDSVPPTQGIEFAGQFRRYPHLGWLVPSQELSGLTGDLAYLGPQQQNIGWLGLRTADSCHVFLRPGAIITLTPWYIAVSD
jgi:hypothetical protein